jgi:hypothetical protein
LAVGAGEEVVPTSEYRALQYQVRELQRLLGKKTLENEILREALDLAPKKRLLRSLSPAGRHTVKAISDTLGVASSILAMQAASGRTRKRRGRRPQPKAALVTEIKTLIDDQPTYGYRRRKALQIAMGVLGSRSSKSLKACRKFPWLTCCMQVPETGTFHHADIDNWRRRFHWIKFGGVFRQPVEYHNRRFR